MSRLHKSHMKVATKWKYVEGTTFENFNKALRKMNSLKKQAIIYSRRTDYRIFELDEEGNKVMSEPPNSITRMMDNSIINNTRLIL